MNYCTVTFPRDISDIYLVDTATVSIMSVTHITFTSIHDTTVMLYKNPIVILSFNSVKLSPLTSKIKTNATINIIKNKIINNSIKLRLSGKLITTINAVCLDHIITIPIPNSNDNNIAYQYHLPFIRSKGFFTINYIYSNQHFIILSMYFTMTKSPYITQAESIPARVLL